MIMEVTVVMPSLGLAEKVFLGAGRVLLGRAMGRGS